MVDYTDPGSIKVPDTDTFFEVAEELGERIGPNYTEIGATSSIPEGIGGICAKYGVDGVDAKLAALKTQFQGLMNTVPGSLSVAYDGLVAIYTGISNIEADINNALSDNLTEFDRKLITDAINGKISIESLMDQLKASHPTVASDLEDLAKKYGRKGLDDFLNDVFLETMEEKYGVGVINDILVGSLIEGKPTMENLSGAFKNALSSAIKEDNGVFIAKLFGGLSDYTGKASEISKAAAEVGSEEAAAVGAKLAKLKYGTAAVSIIASVGMDIIIDGAVKNKGDWSQVDLQKDIATGVVGGAIPLLTGLIISDPVAAAVVAIPLTIVGTDVVEKILEGPIPDVGKYSPEDLAKLEQYINIRDNTLDRLDSVKEGDTIYDVMYESRKSKNELANDEPALYEDILTFNSDNMYEDYTGGGVQVKDANGNTIDATKRLTPEAQAIKDCSEHSELRSFDSSFAELHVDECYNYSDADKERYLNTVTQIRNIESFGSDEQKYYQEVVNEIMNRMDYEDYC